MARALRPFTTEALTRRVLVRGAAAQWRRQFVSASSVDHAEVQKFASLASRWWDPDGPMAGLHQMQPTRMQYIRHAVLAAAAVNGRRAAVEGGDPRSTFAGLRVMDVGCGAGLLTEPLARLGATAVGVDATGPNIDAARWHATLDPALEGRVEYYHSTVEDLAAQPKHARGYDAVCALEIIEHLAPGSLPIFFRGCASCLKPGGVLIVSTINRTAASYALAIVTAEQVLRWVEPGTHQWDKFVTVEECGEAMIAAGLQPRKDGLEANGHSGSESYAATGMVFDPLSGTWGLSSDTAVNYICSATLPEEPLEEL